MSNRAAPSPLQARLQFGSRLKSLARQRVRSERPQRGPRSLFGRGGAVVKADAEPLVLLPYASGGGPRPPGRKKLLWVTFFAFVALCMLGVGVWLLAPPLPR